MNVTPTIANATPMISYGQRGPPASSGTSLPAAKLTASVVNPVLHQARKVLSFARWVRRVASGASVAIPENFGVAWGTPPEVPGLLSLQDEPKDFGQALEVRARGHPDQEVAKVVVVIRVLKRLGLSTSAERLHVRGMAEARLPPWL